MKVRIAGIAITLTILIFIVSVLAYFAVFFTPITQYNETFASHATMAYDQSTFEGMREQILIIWVNMNQTFGTENQRNIYNTWWPPDQTYENSLVAENDYFRNIIARLDQTITEKEQILSGNKTILVPYSQWYQQTLASFREETKREGGLLWAIDGAYFQTFAPMAYHWIWWLMPLEGIIIVLAFVAWLFALE